MIAKVTTVAAVGFDGVIIDVETDLKQGLPAMHIVGMGNKAVDEARERVRSAITHSLLDFPARKFIVNLAPAELPKDGAQFDLPIALSILVASGQLRQREVDQAVFAGELSLGGEARPIRGALLIAEAAKTAGYHSVYVPNGNAATAALIEGITVYGVRNLQELFLHLKKEVILTPATTVPPDQLKYPPIDTTIDDIYGQDQAKRALQIAAAGHHNVLLFGPPGAGKTMLAKALVSLLPPLSKAESLAVTKIHSIINDQQSVITTRPFRAPHHSSSTISLIGGSNKPRPGEISLAHKGVLFLDELLEYSRSSLEALRQPLEDKSITISRAYGRITYPADFMLVATMNPCPCGYYGDQTQSCSCSMAHIQHYQRRLSGPLLDRFDIVLEVTKLKQNDILLKKSLNKNQHYKVFEHIISAVTIQKMRHNSGDFYNGQLSSADIKSRLAIDPEAQKLLDAASKRLNLSALGYFKTIKVAQTIADLSELAASDNTAIISSDIRPIQPSHIAEALQFRTDLAGGG